MNRPSDPPPRLRVSWSHDGLSCELDGTGSVGPMLVLMGLPLAMMGLFAAVPAPLTAGMLTLSFPAAYFLSATWAEATLDPIKVTLRRNGLTWKSGWQPLVTLDLARVVAVRVRPWGLVVFGGETPLRLFSPSRSRELQWLADQIEAAAQTAREAERELDTPEQRARRAALDQLRTPESPDR